MRNVLAYPITVDEVSTELRLIKEEFHAEERIGGMRGMLIDKVQEFLDLNREAFAKYLEDNPL